jgi:hypothetical protein
LRLAMYLRGVFHCSGVGWKVGASGMRLSQEKSASAAAALMFDLRLG